jgi:hypothetical protein
MSPFKVLYGYEPRHIPCSLIPNSKVEAVDDLLKERYNLLTNLKEQLAKAQEMMKLYENRKR